MTTRINNPDTAADILLKECIDNKTSFVMVAGAGSGKTTSLVKALAYVSHTMGQILRKKQQKVACITYTTVAESEILGDVGNDPLFHVSTIHSFLWELIRPFQKDIKEWVKQRIDLKIIELTEQQNNFSSRVQQRTRDKNVADILKYKELKEHISTVNHFKYETGSNYAIGLLGHDDIIKVAPQLINDKPLLKSIIVQKYPYFFVDESQDTLKDVISSLTLIDDFSSKNFCVGFFGDPMQKIYVTGVGKIPPQQGWKEIEKPENFRCPKSVLDVINNIRSSGDTLKQTGGRKALINGKSEVVTGTARLFILPNDTNREENITKVRRYIAEKNNDQLWLSDSKEADLKVLVIEHRMAAKRLDFADLYSAFKDNSTESLAISFSEGKSWALRPFQQFILPLLIAYRDGNHFLMMELLRTYCPLFKKENIKTKQVKPSELLSLVKDRIVHLNELMQGKGSSIKDILRFVKEHDLYLLDDRISNRLNDEPVIDDEGSVIDSVLDAYFACPSIQLWGYQTYINDESAYSTQHSIKGSEFQRVLIILDDEEGKKSFLYSYEKLFGIKENSKTDDENIAEGKESVFDRTRRLFYVCCSRAVQDLAVILFVPDVPTAHKALQGSNIFPKEDIHIFN